MHENSRPHAGQSRRDFLKKAGAVAWVVPTLQVVNMAVAGAGDVGGSIVTSTSTSTTTEAPGCQQYVYCTIKAEWTGNGYSWSDGALGTKACVTEQSAQCNGGAEGFQVSGDERSVTVTAPAGCYIVEAAHKSGSGDADDYCTPASISADQQSATFSAVSDDRMKDISNIQMVIKCCVEEDR